ncbi:hypothetical protein FRB96_002218 [Tulasnella sp. 330]|nr:hypothetical protein FRB96_002218 [Tulasnella sp. 330]KAG8887322.1 hypothetical protein FRB98_000250 [Tulasnella sp. 332]
MAAKDAINVERQLVFYGAYHSNPYNIAIHILCVPLILWSAFVFLAVAPVPQAFPTITHDFNPYLAFEFNWAFLLALSYNIYYIVLEPVAGLLYAPQMAAMVLSAIAFAHRDDGVKLAVYVHVFSWVMQFVGHGVAEKRAPALLDNILGALVLAPFFVHLEILFAIGYNKPLHKTIVNGSKVEIAKFRREKAQEQRATERDALLRK